MSDSKELHREPAVTALRTRRRSRSLIALTGTIVGAFGVIVLADVGSVKHPHVSAPVSPAVITPVQGLSNLERLGLSMDSSGMGRTGQWGPAPTGDPLPLASVTYSGNVAGPTTLSGADLYRLDCQPCHQADGGGAPPEINAIIGPVQATSAVVMFERMKTMGRPITPAFAVQLANGSRKDLMDRLKNGGKKMPSFGHLKDGEIRALTAYLELLAGVPGAAERQSVVTEPGLRVGELLVKGTCHICHNATGPWPDPEELLQGAVPPLGLLAKERAINDVIRKVRHGTPVVMGRARVSYRGRMPVFEYLKDDEVSAAYMYLLIYPPENAERP
ncbi:MAG TPA: cytochrome c [Thermoanaerobaculia bacterium]